MAGHPPLCYNGFILTKGEIMDYDDILQDAFENHEEEHMFDEEGKLEELEDMNNG
jgi:hypothetical protein